MSIGQVFSRGLDGLAVSQRGLSIVSNNIANLNTPGYARQEMIVAPRGGVGGAQVIKLQSVVNPFIELQLFNTANNYGYADGRRKTVEQVEQVFNEVRGGGLNEAFNEFFNSWQTLSQDAGSTSYRQAVIQKGILLTERFNSMANQLNQMRRSLSAEIQSRLDKINQLASNIAELNERIVSAGDSNATIDLETQRRFYLRQLSEEINVDYYEQENGLINITLAGGVSLVHGFNARELSMSDNLGDDGEVSIAIEFGQSTIDVTDSLTGGRLGGTILDRNETLNERIDELDELAYEFATQFNLRHNAGFGLNGNTNLNFFAAMGSSVGAAASISIDALIQNDPANLAAAASDPAGVSFGDNGNIIGANGILNLQSDTTTMNGGTQSFNQYYQSIITDVGATAAAVNRSYETNENLLTQIELQRESVSGVNMDEEGANLIRYQRAFQASARLMTIADQLLGSLMEL